MSAGSEEGIIHILPYRCHDSEVLVQFGEFDVRLYHFYRTFQLCKIHGMQGFRRVIREQFHISAQYRELIPDIMPGYLCKKVQFFICKLEGIVDFLNIRYIMKNTHQASSAT